MNRREVLQSLAALPIFSFLRKRNIDAPVETGLRYITGYLCTGNKNYPVGLWNLSQMHLGAEENPPEHFSFSMEGDFNGIQDGETDFSFIYLDRPTENLIEGYGTLTAYNQRSIVINGSDVEFNNDLWNKSL